MDLQRLGSDTHDQRVLETDRAQGTGLLSRGQDETEAPHDDLSQENGADELDRHGFPCDPR